MANLHLEAFLVDFGGFLVLSLGFEYNSMSFVKTGASFTNSVFVQKVENVKWLRLHIGLIIR
jgi:hypothetical protein